MRCPKCGYISFDYNQVCSKCSKDISTEQEKLNIPAFRPNPPSLLAALTGDASESQVGIRVDESSVFGTEEHGSSIEMDDSAAMGGEEIAFAESQEMDTGLDVEESGEFGSTGDTGLGADELSEDFSFDEVSENEVAQTGELSLEDPGAAPNALAEEEDLGLDFDVLSEEAPALEDLGAEAAPELPELEEVDLDLDLEGLPDEALAGLEEAAEGADQEEMTADLDLDALGEEAAGPGADLDLDFDSIALDDLGGTGEPGQASEKEEAEPDLGASSLEMGTAELEEGQGQIELNIDDLKVNETGQLEIGAQAVPSEEEETSFDMDELSLDEALPGGEGAELDLDEDEEASDIDLDEIGLGDEPVLKTAKGENSTEELIDLDDLDIELDLGEPDNKSS